MHDRDIPKIKASKSDDPNDSTLFKKQRNIVNKEIRLTKQAYYQNSFREYMGDSRRKNLLACFIDWLITADLQVVKEPSARGLTEVSRKRMFHPRVKGLYSANKGDRKASSTMTYPYVQPTNEKAVSPEELHRLSKALEEINRKIHSQNLVWKTLL